MKLKFPPHSTWPEPRSLEIALGDGEKTTPAWNLAEQPEFEDAVTPWLDGQPHRYCLPVHWDNVTVDRFQQADFTTGTSWEIRWTSAAKTYQEFRVDYWKAIRQALAMHKKREAMDRLLCKSKARRAGRLP